MVRADDPEVLILGAGIAGCALAYHLGLRGLRALVVDPRPRAGGATGRAAGIVTGQLWNSFDIAVTREARAEARTLLEGSDPRAYWANGFVRWTARAPIRASLRAALPRLRSEGVEAREVGAGELRELFEGSRFPEEALGLYSESDVSLTPSALAESYAKAAESLGAQFETGRAVSALLPSPQGWTVTVAGSVWSAPSAVIAAGAWSKRVLEGLGRPLPLCPYRTQAALLRPARAPSGDFPSIHDIDTDVYLRPELSGRILAGDGTESVEADPERFVPGGDPAFVAHLAESLAGSFPVWAESEVTSAWAGVCTATPDRRPLVGSVPGTKGLYVMTGFNGFGVMRSGGVARRLAHLIHRPDDASARVGLLPVRPERFQGPVHDFPPRPGFTLEGGDDPRC